MPLRICNTTLSLILVTSIVCFSSACTEKMTDAQLLEAAQASLSENKPREAVIHIKNVLKNQPKQIEARLLLAEAYKQLGDHSSAENELVAAKELGADETTTTLLIVEALVQQQKYEELVKIDAELTDDTSRSKILTEQAKAYLALKQPEKAVQTIERAVTLAPASAEANTTKAIIVGNEDLDSAKILAQALIEEHPDYAPAYSLLGRIERTQEDQLAAETSFSKALNIEESFQDYFMRAMVRIALNDTDGAQLDIDNARRFLPDYFELDYAQGLLDFRRGNLEGAKASLQEAYTANNSFPPTLFYLSAVNFQLGFLAEAETMAYNYVFMNPGYLSGKRLLTDIYLRRGKYKLAEEVINPIVKENPEDIGVLSQLADALRGQGKRTLELSALERMMALAPDVQMVNYRIGSALLFLNQNTERGVELLKSTLAASPTHFGAANDLVSYYSKSQKHKAAIALAQQFLKDSTKENPKNTQAYNLLGLAYANAGDMAAAKATFEQALKQLPADPVTNNNLATLAIQKKDYKAARQRLNNVISGYGLEYSTLINLAALDRLEGKLDNMVAHLEQAQTANAESPDPAIALTNHYLKQGMAAKAQQAFGQLAERFTNDPNILTLAGRVQLATGNLDGAEKTFKNLIQLLPKNANSHFLMSQAYASKGELASTTAELKSALKLDPDHFLARLNLAQILFKSGKLKETEQQLEKLEEIAPGNTELAYLRGKIARKSGDMDEALKQFLQMVESAENTQTTLAVAQQEWDMDKPTLAIVRLENWLTDHKDDIATRLYLAKYYISSNRSKDAIAQYERILTQAPNHVLTLNNLAWEVRSSEPKRAVEYAQKAFDLTNGNANIADTLAVAQMHNGDYRLALRSNDSAIANRTLENSPGMFYHRAQILAKLGQKEESKQLLQKLIKSDTGFAEKTEAIALLNSLK